MPFSLQVTFRNMPPSAAVETHLREKAAKLESFCDRITSCRVTVEAPHRHHHKGNAFQVHIELSVPGRELVINRAPNKFQNGDGTERASCGNQWSSKHAAHEDVYVAIRDAFNAAGRKLQDYVRRQESFDKVHARAVPAPE